MTMKRPLVFVLGLALAAGSALAQNNPGPKYKREGGAKLNVKVKQTELTKGLKENTQAGKSNFVPEENSTQSGCANATASNARSPGSARSSSHGRASGTSPAPYGIATTWRTVGSAARTAATS